MAAVQRMCGSTSSSDTSSPASTRSAVVRTGHELVVPEGRRSLIARHVLAEEGPRVSGQTPLAPPLTAAKRSESGGKGTPEPHRMLARLQEDPRRSRAEFRW